jgi:F420-dependent oxidoreductase-like protein
MERTAAFLGVAKSLSNAVGRVQLAESLGYESTWTTQIAGRDTLMVLTEYARGTERIKLGTGVVPIYSRTPAMMAQTAATLGEISGGRFICGIGVSHKPAVEAWYGQPYEHPLRDMREYLTILRGILDDGGVGAKGERFSASFGWLGYEPPHRVPVYISALSPKMCRLAGEMAHGAVLWCCTPDYIRDHVIPNVRAGAEEAGRNPDSIEIVAAVPACATTDRDAARAALARDLFVYWTLPNYRRAIRRAGYEDGLEAFDEALASGGRETATAAIPAEFLDALGAFGSPEDVREKVAAYRTAGATVPAVGPFSGHVGAQGAEATLRAAAG